MSPDQQSRYYREGIELPHTPEPGSPPQPWQETHAVGRQIPRVDAYQRVSGAAKYTSDISLGDMLFAAIVRCPHPRAVVKGVDAEAAKKLEGVRAVITGSTPGVNLDWPYEWGSDTSRLFYPQCRFEGEEVAAVAADTPYHAADAIRAIKVDYEVLPFVVDENTALDPKMPAVHDGDMRIANDVRYVRGDPDKGFSDADVVLECQYSTRCEIQTPLELHGTVASWEGDRLTLWDSTQGAYSVQEKVAQVLGLPLAKVRVIAHYMGGGFGSKLEAGKYTVIAAILAKITGRPVKLLLTREETFLATGNRPPAHMRLKAGVKNDGTLTALDFSCLATGGAYQSGGVELIDWLVRDLYTCPNVRCECTDVYINAGQCRPFRAPGHPQGSWALEQMMDSLAEAINMDPVDLRLKNVPAFSQARAGNPPYTTTGLRECLEEGAKAFGWKERRAAGSALRQDGPIRTGIGMAACSWIVGGGWPPATIVLKLFSDGSANLNMGASDIGTGTKTVMALVVAEELGLDPGTIQIEHADTGTTQFASGSGGSKTVPTESPAVRAAAVEIKRQLLAMAADDLNTDSSKLVIRGGEVLSTENPANKKKITEISAFSKRKVLVGVGYRGPNPREKAIVPFGAQFCEVKVDTRTGEVEIVRFVASHDSGRVMDRLTYDSQVIGGIAMGIGFGTTEERVLDHRQTGKLCNKNWHDYKLPTALDVPADIDSAPIDRPDHEANTVGAKGLGEPVTVPTDPAIANAVYNATAVRVTDTPITPMQLSRLLAKKHERR